MSRTQFPQIKSASGSLLAVVAGPHDAPATARRRKPTGVTSPVQIRVLYQGSDSFGVW